MRLDVLVVRLTYLPPKNCSIYLMFEERILCAHNHSNYMLQYKRDNTPPKCKTMKHLMDFNIIFGSVVRHRGKFQQNARQFITKHNSVNSFCRQHHSNVCDQLRPSFGWTVIRKTNKWKGTTQCEHTVYSNINPGQGVFVVPEIICMWLMLVFRFGLSPFCTHVVRKCVAYPHSVFK